MSELRLDGNTSFVNNNGGMFGGKTRHMAELWYTSRCTNSVEGEGLVTICNCRSIAVVSALLRGLIAKTNNIFYTLDVNGYWVRGYYARGMQLIHWTWLMGKVNGRRRL